MSIFKGKFFADQHGGLKLGSVDVNFAAALVTKKASHKERDADNNGLFSRNVTPWMAFLLASPKGLTHFSYNTAS
jgi:hypothetical protein